MPLQSTEPRRLYRQIADRLRTLIANGEFIAGARLPSERDLARQFDVSRPSVREALIALEVAGWIEVRIGSGVYVLDRPTRAPHPVDLREWGPLELIRARRVVEGETAALAALHGKRKHFDAMSRAIDTMHLMADSNIAPLDSDRAFHLAIVEASGNAVLIDTVQGFWDARNGPLFTRLGGYFETPRSWRSAIAEHQAIHAAVVARDAMAARAAMHRHMDKSHQRFSASWRLAQAG